MLLASPRGFCAGVEMAIKALAWMVRVFEPPVYCYHEIVHNQVVVDRFRQLGVVFVDDVSEVPAGRPLMLSAHGSAPEVVEAARASGGAVVNAVCPLVTKVHHEVKLRASKGYSIVYVGHEGHEEAIATMAVAPDAIHRVESVAEVEALPDPDGPVAFLAQTTLAVDEWRSILEAAQRALARPLGAGAQRPVLRHDQPSGCPSGHRRSLRHHGRHRQRQLLQHPGPGTHGPGRRLPPGPPGQPGRLSYPTTSPAWSASSPAPRRLSRWSKKYSSAWPRPGHRRGARRARGRVLPPPPRAERGAPLAWRALWARWPSLRPGAARRSRARKHPPRRPRRAGGQSAGHIGLTQGLKRCHDDPEGTFWANRPREHQGPVRRRPRLSAVSQAEADRTFDVIVEAGINHIDVAASYGDAEDRIRPWLARAPGQFFLATKTGERTGSRSSQGAGAFA